MELDELKRKLRQFKKFEIQLRFGNINQMQNRKCIWDEYFSTKDDNDKAVKYNLRTLLGLDHQALKDVFGEYYYDVYFQYYKENGITGALLYDIELLSNLGLPRDSTIEDIKKKFRELAKKYHPDKGGDSSKFIELVDTYRKLTGDE